MSNPVRSISPDIAGSMPEGNSVPAKRAFRVASLGALFSLSACSQQRLVVLFPAGDVAVQQRNLIAIATALMLIVVVPVIVMTIAFSLKYNAKRGAHNYDPNFDHSTSLELVIWSIPLLIITILGAITWSTTHLLDPFRPLERLAPGKPIPATAKYLDVQVVGMDWKWLFIYPEQGIATVNELALPVDTPVRFSMTSTSQFNTFYAPTLAGMIYVMPGMNAKLHAVLNQPVESFGYSGNYTGRGYSDMRFALHGLQPAQFNQWVAAVKAKGGALQPSGYVRLEQPSEKVPVMRFGAVSPGLYARILNRCVAPGKPCLYDVMMHDRMRGGGNPADMRPGEGIPPSRESAPLNGEKPKPALEKSPAEKGSGPNVTKPAHPAPGELKPGDAHNRDLSAVWPESSPAAPARSAAA